MGPRTAAVFGALFVALVGCSTPLSSPTNVESASCSLLADDANAFVLIRGNSAESECALMLSDLASSTVHRWTVTAAVAPPSSASALFCDQTDAAGNRITIWGDSMADYGRTICSEVQTGVFPALLPEATPTDAPAACTLTYVYESGTHRTQVIVRGPAAMDECSNLASKLPQGPWDVSATAYSAFSVCSGQVGKWAIEIDDSAFNQPPAWTQQICSELAGGSLGK